MRNLLILLVALVMSPPVIAQSFPEDFYGDWTFKFKDNKNNGDEVSMVLNFRPYEEAYVFVMPDGKGLISVGESSYYNSADNTITFDFDKWSYNVMVVDGYTTDESVYAIDTDWDTNNMTNIVRTTYDVKTKKASNPQFYYLSKWRDAQYICFKATYKTRSGNDSGEWDYALVDMYQGTDAGGSDSDEKSINVSLQSVPFVFATSFTTANFNALFDVDAKGFDNYDVHYNLHLDNSVIVSDTKAEKYGDGVYLVSVEDLPFERNYTLNVWATSGDYKSPVATAMVSTGEAPYFRLSTKAEDVTETSATISVTPTYWNVTDPIFEISAESANGPKVEDLKVTGTGTGKFELTGLTPGTEYTYSLSYTATDAYGFDFVKENAASVTFTTKAAATPVSIELGKINYTVDEKEGVKFTVEVNATGLADDQTVDVYYYVQGDQSGKNGTAEKPEKAKLDGKVYTFTLSKLEPDKNNKNNEYTAVIFAGVGTFGLDGFIQSKEEAVKFSAEPAKTKVTISFPEGSYYSEVQDDNHAKIVVNPVVDFVMTDEIKDNWLNLYYDLYLDNELKEKEVKLHQGQNYTYDCEIKDLLFSREYKVEVYAKVIDLIDKNWVLYESDHTSFTTTTVPDPNAGPAPAVSVELGKIEYTATDKDATFSVNVNAKGLTDNQKVDVYYYLQADGKDDGKKDDDKKDDGKDDDKKDDKSEGKNGTADNPAVATLGDNGVYTFTLSDLEADKNYTVVIFAGVGTFGSDEFVQSEEESVSFKTESLKPEITVSFPEGSYYSEMQDASYAQIVVQPKVDAQNVSDYIVELFYNLYLGNTLQKEEVKVSQTGAGYEFKFKIPDLMFSREYKVEVCAKAYDYFAKDYVYTSAVTSFTLTTVSEPGVEITTAEAVDVTETSATLKVDYKMVGVDGDVSYTVAATCNGDGPAVESVTTTETSVTFELNGLASGTTYTYNLAVTATDANGKMYMANKAVSFTTESSAQSIELDGISYVQTVSGATFTVKELKAEGFDDDADLAVYFQLSDSDAAPAKATLVENDGETYYEYTFTGLKPNTPYTAVVFGGAGEYGTDTFFKGKEYKQNFVSGDEESGVNSVETVGDVRYFDLQGTELKNPAKGRVYIKVEGNKAVKVVK